MKRHYWRRALGGVIAAAVFVAAISFSTSTAPSGLVAGDGVISSAGALDCMWAYQYGPTIQGGGPGGVSIQASTHSAYFAWMLYLAGCGGTSGPMVATDVDLWGHGGNSNWDPANSYAFYSQPGDHYGIHSGSSAHFVMWYLVTQRQTTVNFGWPPAPPASCGEYWDYDEGSQSCYSPIIIDLKKGEVKGLTSAADGVLFDIDADGVFDQVGWTKPNKNSQAILVIDRDGDGVIPFAPNGRDLLGNFTIEGGSKNGFDALDKLVNGNGDGVVDAQDPLFSTLYLWVDASHDGFAQPEELQPAGNSLESIGLSADIDPVKVDKNGNQYYWKGYATLKGNGKRADREVPAYDVYLVKQ